MLDVAAVGPGVSGNQALKWTTEVAQAAERLGFHRLWVAEHHGIPDIGASTPAVLLAHLAAQTTTLRLGAGGVMLPNHAPLVVAEQFRTLHALHPGRIDLGVGRARGAEPTTALALDRGSTAEPGPDRADQLDELIGFLDGGFPRGHPYEHIRVSPEAAAPPIYLLGSSEGSAVAAAQRGLPFAFAHHLAPEITVPALAAYRDAFQAGAMLSEPYAIVTVLVACAPVQEDAERAAVAATAIRVRRHLAAEQLRAPSVSELLAPQLTPEEAQLVKNSFDAGGVVVGDPGVVRAGMEELAQRTQADELMVCTLEYKGASRIRTLTSIREAA